MGLQSTTLDFKGDPRLEACLVSHPAHVKQGDSGTYVSKIQQALIRLDSLKIDRRELSSQTYGPSTAAAVLKYKKKRHIINTSYQSQEDDIVGKMTIASLDNELARRYPFQPLEPGSLQVAKELPPPSLKTDKPKSRNFSIRCREAYSIGPVVIAKVRMSFDIFDNTNHVSAEYNFVGGAAGLGTPISTTDPGPFSDFTTPDDRTAGGFEGPGSYFSAGGADNSTGSLELQIAVPPIRISVNTGFTAGFDVVSVTSGYMKLIESHQGPPRDLPGKGA